jgi:hypothetical protein
MGDETDPFVVEQRIEAADLGGDNRPDDVLRSLEAHRHAAELPCRVFDASIEGRTTWSGGQSADVNVALGSGPGR